MKSAKFELNLNIEFRLMVLFIIITNRKGFGITCSIPRSGMRDRNHRVTHMYPVPVEKIYK